MTYLITALALAALWLLRNPLRRLAERHLSENGQDVLDQLALPGWELTTFNLVRKETGLALQVGFGFWKFDILDKDYISELTLLDRFVLWPRALAVRGKLKRAAPANKP